MTSLIASRQPFSCRLPGSKAAACLVLGAVASTLTVWAGWPYWRDHPIFCLATAAVCGAFVAGGALLSSGRETRPTGILLALAGVSWTLTWTASWDSGIFPALASYSSASFFVLTGSAVLHYPLGRLSRLDERLWVVSAAIVLWGGQFLVMLHSTPAWWGYAPEIFWPAARPDKGQFLGALWVTQAGYYLLAAFYAVVLWRKSRRLRGLDRTSAVPVLMAVALVGVLSALVQPSQGRAPSFDDALRVYALQGMVATVVPAALLAGALRARWTELAAVRTLTLLRLSRPPTPDGLQSAMRSALRDRELDLLFWVDDAKEYVDVRGCAVPADGQDASSRAQHRAAAPPGSLSQRIKITGEGRPLAAVDVDGGSEQHRQLVLACLQALRPDLASARAQATLQARVEQVTRAQSRLVAADNQARSLMEREIHDGLHQRLLASALDLSTIEEQATDEHTRRLVAAARGELLDLVSEVRRLVRGIHPVDLSQNGVSGALEALAERQGIRVRVSDHAGRLPVAIEATVYFALTEALINSVRHAAGATVEITLTLLEGSFLGRVRHDGPGGAAIVHGGGLAVQRDRVRALGGCVTLNSDGSGTTVEVRIPCR